MTRTPPNKPNTDAISICFPPRRKNGLHKTNEVKPNKNHHEKLILTMAVAVMASAPAMAQKVNTQAIKTKIERCRGQQGRQEIDSSGHMELNLGKAYYELRQPTCCILRSSPPTTYSHSPPARRRTLTTGIKNISGKRLCGAQIRRYRGVHEPSNNTVRSKGPNPSDKDAYSRQ